MTKTLSINEVQSLLPGLLALAKEGDEIIIEENGHELAKVIPSSNQGKVKPRKFGRGRPEGYFMSDDFNAELPDEFWGFDKDL
jgi:antitoxin (DNA-binding transcriptional repressor) of toxin-antitoxin stability system